MVWPQPTQIVQQRPTFSVKVSPSWALQVQPVYFHQASCRHFLSKAFNRLVQRAFASQVGDPPTYQLWNTTAEATPEPILLGTIPTLHLSIEPTQLLHNDLMSTISSWCNNQGQLLPSVLSNEQLDESYTLNVTATSIDISVQSPVGILRAFSTLSQLIDWNGQHHVIAMADTKATPPSHTVCTPPNPPSPCATVANPKTLLLHVRDAPRYPWRGLMVDTSRHYYSMAGLKNLVNGMELLKLNVFHWHIVDAQSFPFVSTTYPKLSTFGAYSPSSTYTAASIQQFIQYSTERGIRVIPEFDVPGHTASWGRGYPELTIPCPSDVVGDWGNKVPMKEHGIDRVALHPLKNSTYVFLNNLFKEIFLLFPDPVVHIGGDEVNKECWMTDPMVQKYALENGPNWARTLQAMFEFKIIQMCHDHKKTAMVWDEVLSADGVTYQLPKSTIVQWWRGWRPDVPSKSIRLGHRYVLSAPWYLDHTGDDWLKMYKAKVDANMHGGEAASWSEHANEINSEHRIFSRLPSVAEKLWSTSSFTEAYAVNAKSIDQTAHRLGDVLCRLNKRVGIRVAPAYPDYCGNLINGNRESSAVQGDGNTGSSLQQLLNDPLYKNAITSVREWQFVAFSLGALVLFGLVAFVAWCLSKKILSNRTSLHYGPIRKQKKRRKTKSGGRRDGQNKDRGSGSDGGSVDESDGDIELAGLIT